MKKTSAILLTVILVLCGTAIASATPISYHYQYNTVPAHQVGDQGSSPSWWAPLHFPDGTGTYVPNTVFEYDNYYNPTTHVNRVTQFLITLHGADNASQGYPIDVWLSFTSTSGHPDYPNFKIASVVIPDTTHPFDLVLNLLTDTYQLSYNNGTGSGNLLKASADLLNAFRGYDSFYVGYGCHFDHDYTAVDVTVNNSVPEPATMLLLGLGLIGLAGIRRKFKN